MKIQFILHNHMIENPSPLQQARILAYSTGKTGGKLAYLVFDSSFLSGAVFGGGVVSPGLTAPPGIRLTRVAAMVLVAVVAELVFPSFHSQRTLKQKQRGYKPEQRYDFFHRNSPPFLM